MGSEAYFNVGVCRFHIFLVRGCGKPETRQDINRITPALEKINPYVFFLRIRTCPVRPTYWPLRYNGRIPTGRSILWIGGFPAGRSILRIGYQAPEGDNRLADYRANWAGSRRDQYPMR